MDYFSAIRDVYHELGIIYRDPELTTVGQLAAKISGNCRGHYYINPKTFPNFYFGKAIGVRGSENMVINKRFTKNHEAKLKMDLPTLYGPAVEKVQPARETPTGWAINVPKLYKDCNSYPQYSVKIGPKRVKPGILEHNYVPIENIDDIPVYIWNLNDLSSEQISLLEEKIITKIWPAVNSETVRKNKKSFKNNS